ncbi:MAG: hypothetical protein COB04_10450 [Gammaproteobacteria bacterium]|nr:MAG: hypothetical protein COB04_10450 [Gammaproteobacteria bacterium]
MKKDKVKVTEEVLSDEKIKRFLDYRPYDQSSVDHHILLTAYRGLNESDFEKFIGFFQAENLDISAANKNGKTLLELAQQHNASEAYVNILQQAGS